MSYGTIAQFRALMAQAPTGTAQDELIQGYLDRATGMVEGRLGFQFADWAAASAKDIRVRRATDTLYLPSYLAGSITSIYEVYAKGTTSEDTDEVESTEYDILDDYSLYRDTGWGVGWYRITAQWGYGPAPDKIVQVVLEKAINLYIGSQGGQFSDVVGVAGGGAVGYNRAWTNQQLDVIEQVRIEFGRFGMA